MKENIENNSHEKILENLNYHTVLLNIILELKKIGLKIDKNEILDFKNLAEKSKWSKINGKKLQSFQNTIFNRKNGIGSKRWTIQDS